MGHFYCIFLDWSESDWSMLEIGREKGLLGLLKICKKYIFADNCDVNQVYVLSVKFVYTSL